MAGAGLACFAPKVQTYTKAVSIELLLTNHLIQLRRATNEDQAEPPIRRVRAALRQFSRGFRNGMAGGFAPPIRVPGYKPEKPPLQTGRGAARKETVAFRSKAAAF